MSITNEIFDTSNKKVINYDNLEKIKQLEEALRKSDEKFKSFFDDNKTVILQINPKNRKIVNCNESAVIYYGYTKEELLSKTIDQLNTLPIDKIKEKMQKAIKEKSNFFQFKHKLANGEIRDVELYASPINIEGEVHLFSMIYDVTERVKAEKSLIENQRLSAIGEMASSIAHDFNNSLQSISGNIELCIIEDNTILESKEKLKTIQLNVEDANMRVKSLLNFSGFKNKENKREIIDLNALLDNIIFQGQPLWRSEADKKGITIKITKNYESDLFIEGNKGLITSAIFNVFKNSIEAMPSGGNITFLTKKNNNKIYINISDTGIGMDEETKIRMFQPFFSTKGFELGRGLGMSGVYSIVKEYGGNIYIKETKVNKGTEIEIVFPYKDDIQNILENKQQIFNKKTLTNDNKLKILWVDDDKTISLISKKYIKILGHVGDSVISGERALELLKTNKYDVIITDIGMPNMNGWQLIENIRNNLKNNEINIILLSGWKIEEDSLIKKYNIANILQKPITIDDLKEALNIML
jgi:PAS domain S-box-containing protein